VPKEYALADAAPLPTTPAPELEADAPLDPAALASVAATPAQGANDGLRAIDIYFGGRALNKDDWDPLDEQGVLGVQLAIQSAGSLVGFEVGLQGSYDDDDVGGVHVEGSVSELYAGVHKSFGNSASTVRPYVGAGVSLVSAHLQGSLGSTKVSDDDTSGGLYAHGGVAFQLSPNFRLGADLRFLGGTDINLFGANGDADYAQFALFLGFNL
jgi:hypothetical protein